MRSTTCRTSLCGWPAVSSQLLSVNPTVSTTSVAPSQWPIACPIQEGSRSSGWPRPSIQIWRIELPVSKSMSTRFLLCKISNGPTWFIRRGIPYGAQLVRYGSILSSLARPSGPLPQPTSSHRFAAHGCIGGGASGEKLYGKKPLGVLGGDQIPVRSGVEAAACGGAARSSRASCGSSPRDNTSIAAALRTELSASFFIRMNLSFKFRLQQADQSILCGAQYPGGSTVTTCPPGMVTFTGLRLFIPLTMGTLLFSGCP